MTLNVSHIKADYTSNWFCVGSRNVVQKGSFWQYTIYGDIH